MDDTGVARSGERHRHDRSPQGAGREQGSGADARAGPMSIVVHPGQLRMEMARRGLSARVLAREAGVSPPTISAALAGRPISATTLGLIAGALTRIPPVAVIDGLLLNRSEDQGVE